MAKTKKQADIKHQATGPEGDLARRELENQLKRALADYQNLERRVSEERQLLGQLSTALIIEKFLPVLDNLEAAQAHLNDQGLALVIKQFKDVLSSEDVTEIEADGAQFDPNLHEAVETTEGTDEGSIVKILAKGYKMEGKVIRPAKVVVSRKSEAAQQASEVQMEGDTVDSQ